jgi:transcriptional regulator with XRE-family HTH domain
MLSQVERGVTEPSLSTLRRLAGVFGESVASLFDSSPPAVWISRPGARSTLAGPHGLIGYERLTPGNG